MTKKLVTRQIHTAYLDFEGSTLDEAIKDLHKLKDTHGEECFIQSYDDYDDCRSLGLFHQELETDAEYESRLNAERANQEWKRKKYEELKKEFESDTTETKGPTQ